MEIGHFYAHLFGGIFVFRERAEKVVQTRRPPASRTRKSAPQSGDEPAPAGRLTAIFCREEAQSFIESDMITRIPLSAAGPLLGFLLSNGYASFSADLIDARITRLEDEYLLSQRVPVADASYEERCRALESFRGGLPPLVLKLMHLKRAMRFSGSDFDSLISTQESEVRTALLRPACTGSACHVVSRLLTKLFPYDYETMLSCNTADLNECLTDADENKRKYIFSAVQGATHIRR
jgi:hypothetical protein